MWFLCLGVFLTVFQGLFRIRAIVLHNDSFLILHRLIQAKSRRCIEGIKQCSYVTRTILNLERSEGIVLTPERSENRDVFNDDVSLVGM